MSSKKTGMAESLAFQFGATDPTTRALEMTSAMMSAPVLAMWTMAFEAWNPENYIPR